VLHLKRPRAKIYRSDTVFGRFRYSDLKEAACVCDGRRLRDPPKGRFMQKRLIWIDGDDFTGGCCSLCPWGMTAPRLDSTVAALAFNRVAQETFAKHDRLL
jgi:hypothetical protein